MNTEKKTYSEKYYNLKPPPRAISIKTRLIQRFIGSRNIKWCFFVALSGAIFFTFSATYGKEILFGILPKETTQGHITEIERTQYDLTAYFLFYDNSENPIYSYSSIDMKSSLESGDKINIEYIKNFPKFARIKGLTVIGREKFFQVVFTCIFLVSLFGFIWEQIKNSKNIYFLKKGKMVYGSLANQHSKYNNSTELDHYDLEFVYLTPETGDKLNRLKYRSLEISDVTDDPREAIIYLPSNPEKAVLFDSLPGDLDVNMAGKIVSNRSIFDPLFILAVTIALPIIGYKLNYAEKILTLLETILDI